MQIVVLLHSAKDASKVEAAISGGQVDIQPDARPSRLHMGSTNSEAEGAGESRMTSCHGLAAGAVLQVTRFISDEIESDDIELTTPADSLIVCGQGSHEIPQRM